MSTNLTYTSLIADIGAYLEKARMPGTTSYEQLPRIINLSERAIVGELKLQGYERTLQGQMTFGQPIYAKPDRWRETVSMHILTDSGYHPLFPRAYEYCRAYWPDTSEKAEPKFYAEHGAVHHLVVPTPDAGYHWEHKVYMLPKLLGANQETNWITEMAPNALLFRCLMETAEFLKKQEDVARFGAKYAQEMAALGNQDAKKLMDRASERDGV